MKTGIIQPPHHRAGEKVKIWGFKYSITGVYGMQVMDKKGHIFWVLSPAHIKIKRSWISRIFNPSPINLNSMKDKLQVNTEGRAVFYAVLYNRFRAAAIECGYALALHGSMAADMDLLAVPWVEDVKTPDELVSAISDCIDGTVWKGHHLLDRHVKPHGRVSYTLSIMGDWQIDLSITTAESNGEYKMRIVDETAPDLATSVGISESRRIALSKKMYDFSKANAGHSIRACNMWNDILALCHNTEEVVYCVHVHTSWLFEKGYMAYAK